MRAPSMGLTRGLWKNPQRYLDSYWNVIPGIWVHGDFASIDADGLLVGRGGPTTPSRSQASASVPPKSNRSCSATGKVAGVAVVGSQDP